MLDFIYDSLDTVKKLKFPTVKQVARLTAGIFALVIVAGLYFVLADTLFSDGYKAFYSLMTNQELSSPSQPQGNNQPIIIQTGNQERIVTGAVFTGLDLQDVRIENIGTGEESAS